MKDNNQILFKPKKVPFYFLRHGETHWNKERKAMGQTDIPLNEEGMRQAEQTIPLLSSLQIQTICHSPLKRAKHTAEIIHQAIGGSLIEIQDLQENNIGTFQGKTIKDKSWLIEWMKGTPIEGDELFEDFKFRIAKALDKALSYPGPVLTVSHAGVYRALLENLKIKTPNSAIGNCELIYMSPPQKKEQSWSLSSLNNETHGYNY